MTATATLTVTAPLDGSVVALTDVPDPVFAGQILGSGSAIEPADGATDVVVVAPVAGKLVKVHPHAFVILDDSGTGVLVHLGIDTVRLHGAGFTLHVTEGDRVEVGEPVVTFDPSAVRAAGMSAVCPVVVMQSPADSTTASTAAGLTVRRDQPLFTWAAAATA